MLALMVNVSAASPFGVADDRVRFMTQWVDGVVSGPYPPDLVFAQEVTDEWLAAWPERQYLVVRGGAEARSPFKVRSALIARRDLDIRRATLADVPTLSYHHSYLAAACWSVGDASVLLFSLHASPSKVARYRETWPEGVAAPLHRRDGVTPPEWRDLWDSDALLATLRHHARQGQHMLAAGDLNEARNWDLTHPGSDGRDYFAALADAGLHDVLFDRWQEERPTRRALGHPELQLDHVVATHQVAQCVTKAHVEPSWAALDHDPNWSDHAPVWFTFDPDALLENQSREGDVGV